MTPCFPATMVQQDQPSMHIFASLAKLIAVISLLNTGSFSQVQLMPAAIQAGESSPACPTEGVAINMTGDCANPSAMLDVNSQSKGLLIPRMTKGEREAIASPAHGLIIYQTEGGPEGIYVYDGVQWVAYVAGDAGLNVALGPRALDSDNGGSANIAIGFAALQINGGHDNLAIGSQALDSTLFGDDNIAIGRKAMYQNQDGSDNIAIGRHALRNNAYGQENIAIGLDALGGGLGFGKQNVAIGTGALSSAMGTDKRNTGIGAFALLNNTGDENTAVGDSALRSATDGNRLTAIGFRADVHPDVNYIVNATVIGHNAVVDASDAMVFGNAEVVAWCFGGVSAEAAIGAGRALTVGSNSSNGNGAYLTAGGVWTNASDRNAKENFSSVDAEELLKKLCELPITEWNYRGENPDIKHIGPVAQDFHRIFSVGNDSTSISTIDPAGIALSAIQALEKRTQEISELKSELSILKEENERLRSDKDRLLLSHALTVERVDKIERVLERLGTTQQSVSSVSQHSTK